jgi:hypothetical protein
MTFLMTMKIFKKISDGLIPHFEKEILFIHTY